MFEDQYQAQRATNFPPRAVQTGEGGELAQDQPPPIALTALTRWQTWMEACRASNAIGGDNFLKTTAGAFIVDSRPRQLANGAIQGRISAFERGGLWDCGGFKIAADGVVVQCPERVRPFLPGAQEASA